MSFLEYQTVSAILLFLLVGAELAYVLVVHKRPPDIRAHAANGAIFGIDLLLRGASFGLRVGIFMWATSLVPWSVEPSVLSIALTYIAIDFIYYWKHRLVHEWDFGWALHSTHHTSEDLTFFATFRLNWIEAAASYYFFLPLALIGLPALWLLILIEFNDGWQFVCHTKLVNRFRFLDRFMNTPNIHRVHHSRDPELANKNYGSTLMLWDRLFGTYHPGLDEVDAGIEGRPATHNVLSIQFAGLVEYFRPRIGESDG